MGHQRKEKLEAKSAGEACKNIAIISQYMCSNLLVLNKNGRFVFLCDRFQYTSIDQKESSLNKNCFSWNKAQYLVLYFTFYFIIFIIINDSNKSVKKIPKYITMLMIQTTVLAGKEMTLFDKKHTK